MIGHALVLASGSPRRRVLLRRAGFTFEVNPPDVDESSAVGESPSEMVLRLAITKGEVAGAGRTGDLVLAADTAVVLGDRALGKPADEENAVRMLLELSGRSHEVVTGYALFRAPGELLESGTVSTAVHFASIEQADAADYVATGEPMDKAGAYAIQGIGWRFIRSLEGSFTNVMGLPMETIEPLLQRHGAQQQPKH